MGTDNLFSLIKTALFDWPAIIPWQQVKTGIKFKLTGFLTNSDFDWFCLTLTGFLRTLNDCLGYKTKLLHLLFFGVCLFFLFLERLAGNVMSAAFKASCNVTEFHKSCIYFMLQVR